MQTQLDCGGIKFFGLSELMTKANQPHPITVNDRQQVAINDRYNGIMYHRLISSALSQPDNLQWGNKAWSLYKSRMRTVLAFRVNKFDEEFVFDFSNAMPDLLTVDGYKSVDVTNDVTIISDQENIYKTEFGNGDYEKHIVTWNIYALEYGIEFLKC